MTNETYNLNAQVYRRRGEWVLEIEGIINDTAMTIRHTQPGHLPPEEVPGLPSLYEVAGPNQAMTHSERQEFWDNHPLKEQLFGPDGEPIPQYLVEAMLPLSKEERTVVLNAAKSVLKQTLEDPSLFEQLFNEKKDELFWRRGVDQANALLPAVQAAMDFVIKEAEKNERNSDC